VGVGDELSGLVEALEEAVAGAGRARGNPLRLRQRPRALRQQLGAEELAPDRSGEELIEGGSGAAADDRAK
jgi:hypothetical protein